MDKYISSRKIKSHKVKGSRYPRYSLSEIKKVYQGRDKSKSPRDGRSKKDGRDYWDWKAVTEQLKAEKLELELSCKRGDLVQSALVTNFVAEMSIAFKEGIYSAQDRIAPKIDIKTARIIRRELDKAINGIGEAGKKLAEKIRAAIEECNS